MILPGKAYHELVAMYFDLPEDWPGCLLINSVGITSDGVHHGGALFYADQWSIEYAERHGVEWRSGGVYFEFPLRFRHGMTAAAWLRAVGALSREEVTMDNGEIVTFDRSTGDLTFWGGTKE
jgi:hypothetical protein